MFDYVPSPFVLLVAAFVFGFLAYMKTPPILLILLGMIAFAGVYSQHMQLFASEYRTASNLQLFTQFAPFALVGLVILLALGYIFFVRGIYKAPAATTTVSINTTSTQPAAAAAVRNSNRVQNANFLKALEEAV
jgi:hypothetical protein